jgi:hypothetical protein
MDLPRAALPATILGVAAATALLLMSGCSTSGDDGGADRTMTSSPRSTSMSAPSLPPATPSTSPGVPNRGPTPTFDLTVGPDTLYFTRGALPNPVTDTTTTRAHAVHELAVQCWSGDLAVTVTLAGAQSEYQFPCDGQVFHESLGDLIAGTPLSLSYGGRDGTEYVLVITDARS